VKTFLDADPTMSKPANNIINEIHQDIAANTSITLDHDIYFGESLVVSRTQGNILLTLNQHYAFDEKDTVASDLAGKDCYRRVRFLYAYESVKINYHVYGDFIKAKVINDIHTKLDEVSDTVNNEDTGLVKKVGDIDEAINDDETGILARITHIEENGGTGGGGEVDPGISQRVETIEKTLHDEDGVIDRILEVEETINKPQVGLAARTDSLDQAVNATNTGAIARINIIEDGLNNQETGLFKRVHSLEENTEEAAKEIDKRFDDLEETVNDKKDGLVVKVGNIEQTLNEEDTGALARIDGIENTLNEENTGVIARVDNIETALTGNGGVSDRLDSLESAVDDEVSMRQDAIAQEVIARDAAIAQAQLANHTWIPAKLTKAELLDPATLLSTRNYLCRVIGDAATPSNNGVWELIAGASEWTYFSDNADWIDELELNAAIDAHNEHGSSHADIRADVAAEISRAQEVEETLGTEKANKIPALSDIEFGSLPFTVPAGRILEVDINTVPELTPALPEDMIGFISYDVFGSVHKFGAWTNDGGQTTHFGHFDYDSNTSTITPIQDWYDGTVWLSNNYLVKQGITGQNLEEMGTLSGLNMGPGGDIVVLPQPEADLEAVRDEAIKAVSDLSTNRLTRSEFAGKGVKYKDIVDNLESQDAGKPLSARQGKVLAEEIEDTLDEAKTYTDQQIRDAEEHNGTFIRVAFQTKADLDSYTIPERVNAGDFTFVREDEAHEGMTTRYICEVDPDTQEKIWDYAYTLNQNFSAAQMAAINSGITAAGLAQILAAIGGNADAIEQEKTDRNNAIVAHNGANNAHQDIRAQISQTVSTEIGYHDENANAHSDLLAGYAKPIRMPDWTEFTFSPASGSYTGRYSGPYFTGRYWPGGKRIMRVEAILDDYKPSTTAAVIHEGVTPQIPGIAQHNIVNIGGSFRVQDTSKQPYHMPLNTAGVSSALPGNFRVMVAYSAFQLYSVNCGFAGESCQVIMWAEWFEN
jgi:hypothetical protein